MSKVNLHVRTGAGTVSWDGETFTDTVEIANRAPRSHTGWQSITYKRKRYQLFGNVRTPFFICLSNPIR